jgi:hypothetical protein
MGTWKISPAQRKVLKEIGEFGLAGGHCIKNTTQVTILEDHKLIKKIGVSKFAITPTGCEFVGINWNDAMDEVHEMALAENEARSNTQPVIKDTPAQTVETPVAEPESPLFEEGDEVLVKGNRATIKFIHANHAEIEYENGGTDVTHVCRLSKPAPSPVDPRDARIAELEAQVKALQAQIAELNVSDNDDENEMTLDEAREKLPTGSHAYYEGKRVLILETSMYGTERRISSGNEELWVKVWDLKKTKAE